MNYLIDPTQVINYNRTDGELQLFWLFCIVVAGKTAKTQARALDRFLTNLAGDTPFDKISKLSRDDLLVAIKDSRLGQYNRLIETFTQSLRLDLRTVTAMELETLHGVGPKTSRFFLTMSRPNQRYAILDTHILKYMASRDITVPKTTPSGNKYRDLEIEWLRLVDESGMTPAQFDLSIWKQYSGNI